MMKLLLLQTWKQPATHVAQIGCLDDTVSVVLGAIQQTIYDKIKLKCATFLNSQPWIVLVSRNAKNVYVYLNKYITYLSFTNIQRPCITSNFSVAKWKEKKSRGFNFGGYLVISIQGFELGHPLSVSTEALDHKRGKLTKHEPFSLGGCNDTCSEDIR